MANKPTKSIVIIVIFLFSSITSAVGTTGINANKKNNIINAASLFDKIDLDNENIDFQDIENQSYEFLLNLVDNESNIGRCGKAFINSTGRGINIGRTRPLFFINIPIKIYNPIWFMFPYKTSVIWLICSIYYNDNNAQTIIRTVDTNETIYINGTHIIVGGIFLFPGFNRFNQFLNGDKISLWSFPIIREIFRKLLNQTHSKLNDFITTYHGKLFWHKFKALETNNTLLNIILWLGAEGLNLIYSYFVKPYFWQYRRIKIPALSLLFEENWRGYFPFFIWSKI